MQMHTKCSIHFSVKKLTPGKENYKKLCDMWSFNRIYEELPAAKQKKHGLSKTKHSSIACLLFAIRVLIS